MQVSASELPQWSAFRKRRGDGLARPLLALALAVTLQASGVLSLMLLSRLGTRAPRRPAATPRPQSVSLRAISRDAWTQNRSTRAETTRATRPPEAQKQREQQLHGQVVAVAPGNGETSPDARYLAETANHVAKQSRARETTPFYAQPSPRTTALTSSPGPAHDALRAGNGGLGAEAAAFREAQHARQAAAAERQRQRLSALRTPEHEGPGPRPIPGAEHEAVPGTQGAGAEALANEGPTQEASAGQQGLAHIDLSPSASALASVSGAAPNDHLEGVDEGDGTFLNTAQFRYAGFFNRVKQAVSSHWSPGALLLQQHASSSLTTVLVVTLDASGAMTGVQVARSSGIQALDAEAIAAFQRSQPFPNPPAGLAGPDSVIRFQFGFFMDVSSGGLGTRLFRGFR